MRIVLVEPEIPQNTGSIGRLAAATRLPLDLVEPLGFSLEDKYMKRAGLDYWPLVDLHVHGGWAEYHEGVKADPAARLLAFSARAERCYTTCDYREGDRLLFGRETRGLDPEVVEAAGGHVYRIPIFEPGVRSLNLSNSVSIIVYEALRQMGRLGELPGG